MKAKAQSATLLDHTVIEVKDIDASVKFYDQVLQFPPVRLAEYRAGDAPFVSARVNRQVMIDLFPRDMWHNRRKPQNPNHVCFTMSEPQVAALKRRLSRHKIPITRRLPLSYGAQGWGNSIYFEEPDGVTLEVRFYGKNARKNYTPEEQRAQADAAKKGIAAAKKKAKEKG